MIRKICLSTLTTVFIFLSALAGSAQVHVIDSGMPQFRKDSAKAPVLLLQDTLFYINNPIGIYTAVERANRINSILNNILEEGEVEVDSFSLFSSEQNHYIFYKDLPVLAIYPLDTTGIGIPPGDLAYNDLAAIKEGFSKNLPAYNLKTMTRNVLNTSIIILLVIVVIIILNWIFRKILRFLDNRKTKFLKGWHLRNYPLLSSDQQYKLVKNLLFILKIGLIILIIFISLPLIFTMFPATEPITRKLVSLIWNPVNKILMGILGFIPDLITIIIIYIIFRYLVKGLRFLSNEISSEKLDIPGFYPEWASPTFMIARFILYIFMFVMIFPFLPGSDSAVFQGVSVFVGLLISIGSSNAISNAVAGLVITYMRPFKVGDKIKIDDIVGTVLEKSALVTRIRTIKNEDVTIPNAKVLTSHTINYSEPARETGLIIHTTVTIGYDAPWRTVHSLLINAAENTDGVLKNPAPYVLQTSLDDFYISYQINAYISDANRMLTIRSLLHQNIQDSFNRGGVEIMSPHYRSERDGNDITIPKDWESDAMRSPGENPESSAPKKRSPKSKKN